MDSSNEPPYWLREYCNQAPNWIKEPVTGAREEIDWSKEPPKPDWETRRYQEWFEKEYDAVTRPNTGAGNEYYKQASTIELKLRVAELRRSNTFLWVIVLFNAVMGIVFGSRDLFGW